MIIKNTLTLNKAVLFLLLSLICFGCSNQSIKEIHIGYIGPLSVRATDLGIAPSKAMQLAVDQYNSTKGQYEPKITLHIEDDKWEKSNAIPAYEKLRTEYNIQVVFISNSEGTIALQKKILEDDVILINPLNNDKILSKLNQNTFQIAKSTEEANGLVGKRIVDLGLQKAVIFHYPNNFMTLGANEVKKILDKSRVENKIITVEKGTTDFINVLGKCKEEGHDAYVMFGYKEFGFAQKQAREIGITAPIFGSTTQLVPEYFDNSEGALIGSEFPFFTPIDGNFVLAKKFLEQYELKYKEKPFSIWPPMQAYDAMNITINNLREINELDPEVSLSKYLRDGLHNVKYHHGVCGNIAIMENGASKGIYFSLYECTAKGEIKLVTRD